MTTSRVKVHLTSPLWSRVGNVHVRGAAFLANSLHRAADLGRVVANNRCQNELCHLAESLNGFFAFLRVEENRIYAAVDQVRSIPLFYAIDGDEIYLSDDALWLKDNGACSDVSKVIQTEFLLTGYVSGGDTLASGVKQIQPGQLIVIDKQHAKPTIKIVQYYDFHATDQLGANRDSLLMELDRIAKSCIERLALYAKGRPIVVPLSGGYDSRLLVTLLRERRYDNVIAVNYGRPGSEESILSKNVADNLGIRWLFVPYTEDCWWTCFHTEEREAFFRMAHNLTSIPHLQDWPAVWHLKDKKLVPDDSVFVPGHTAAALGGHLPLVFSQGGTVREGFVVEQIFDKHYKLWPENIVDTKMLQMIKKRIAVALQMEEECTVEEAANKMERWEWQERQSKFLINSVKVYDFWGYDWWLPLWDLELIDFCDRLPLSWKLNKKLYADYVSIKYSEVAKLPLNEARKRDDMTIKSKIRNVALQLNLYKIYSWARSLYRIPMSSVENKWRQQNEYDRHPLAWYGIMDRATFLRAFSGREKFHSFISKYMLEDLQF